MPDRVDCMFRRSRSEQDRGTPSGTFETWIDLAIVAISKPAGVAVEHTYGSWDQALGCNPVCRPATTLWAPTMQDKMFIGVDVSQDWVDVAETYRL